MRARGASRRTDRAECVALPHGLTDRHADALQVRHHRGDAVPMIDHDRPTGVIKIFLHQGDHTVRRTVNRRAPAGGDVDPIVGPPRLAVQDPLAPVNTRNRTDRRPHKSCPVMGPVGIQPPHVCNPGIFPADPSQGFFTRCDHAARQAVDALRFILPGFNLELPRLLGTVGITHMQRRMLGRFAAKAKYESAILGDPYGSIVQTKHGTRQRDAEGQATLDQVSVECDVIGAGGCGAEQQEQRQSDPDYGSVSRGGVASAADCAVR